MSSEISNNLILNFDIFKHHSNLKDVSIPVYAQNLFLKLQTSIIKIQDETLQKHVLSNDAVPKVMNELEKSLNCIMMKNLLAVKSIDFSKRIKLGELYNYSVRNNTILKKHLNAIYLTSRVYKTLFKDHPSLDNLKLRLISVRCKAIRDICLNESRRGKIRHLRCSKNPKFIPLIPKKLKSIIRKMNRELQKYFNIESHVPLAKIEEIENILVKDPNSSWENVVEMLDEVVVHYYKNTHYDTGSSECYIKGLMEICQSQNKYGDAAILNYCDQEMAMEYLMMNCDEIENDFASCDSLLTQGKSGREAVRKIEEIDNNRIESLLDYPIVLSMISDVSSIETCQKKEEVEKEDLDILDFENFQLVDVWEEKNEIQSQENSDVGKLDEKLEKRETKSTRRKRRSRFAPLTDEDLVFFQQPRTLGFCSTFVDEDVMVNERQIDLTNIDDPNKHQINVDDEKERERVSINAKMFDVVANLEMCEVDAADPSMMAVNQENLVEVIAEAPVPLNKGELCKVMLRKFHDSLKQAIEGTQKKSESQLASKILESWKTERPSVVTISSEARSASKEIFDNIENKMNVLMRDYVNRSQIKRKLVRLATSTSVVERPLSPSPTPFDQTIEASMKKNRINPPVITHPVVVRRPTRSDSQSSPERARLRAMMLSYKRDVEKNREFGDKREEGQLCSSQSSAYDECGMAELISKAQITKHVGSDQIIPGDNVADTKEFVQSDIALVVESTQKQIIKREKIIASQPKEQDIVAAVDTDSEGLVTSSDDDDDSSKKHQKSVKLHTSTPKENKVEISRMQWLVPPPESITLAPIPAPATPFLDDEPQSWTGRKVFVVDSHDKGSSTAHIVKTFLQKNGARVYDTTNYKQAGKDLHVLVHQDWRFPDSSARIDNAQLSSPISLLLLKNNSGVHFLSYTDLESVSRFSCQTIFPHSRSCIFLDHHALVATHSDNIRNMLDFMIAERQTSNRIWCLKIPCSVYKFFQNKMTENISEADLENLKDIQNILTNYASNCSKGDSMCLVEIQTDDEDITNQQDHVLNQQYYLQKKFRHFCILTDNLNTTELDIGFLSIYGVAVLPLNTFLKNKTGKYIGKTTPV